MAHLEWYFRSCYVSSFYENVTFSKFFNSPARDYELDRSRVELHEIIGEGQFGDVHKGIYHVPSHQISSSNLNSPEGSKGQLPIAVKTCKVEGHDAMAEKFLEEACKYSVWIQCNCYKTYHYILRVWHCKIMYISSMVNTFFRYNATVWSSTYHKACWYMLRWFWTCVDCYGASTIWWTKSLFTRKPF